MGAPVTGLPRWSPDGQLIVFHSNLEGQCEIYVIPAAGGKPRRLTSHPASDRLPASPGTASGSTSARTEPERFRSGRSRHPAGMPSRSQTTSGTCAVRVAGWRLRLLHADFGPPSALWRLPASGGQPVKVLDGVVLGHFAVLDRRHLLYRPAGGRSPASVLRLRHGKSTTVARNLGNVRSRPHCLSRRPHDSFHPDGLLVRRPDAGGELPVTCRAATKNTAGSCGFSPFELILPWLPPLGLLGHFAADNTGRPADRRAQRGGRGRAGRPGSRHRNASAALPGGLLSLARGPQATCRKGATRIRIRVVRVVRGSFVSW